MKHFTNNEVQRGHICDVSKSNNLLGYLHDYEDFHVSHLGYAEDGIAFTAIDKPEL